MNAWHDWLSEICLQLERVGVDLGVKTLATVSDGTCYTMPGTIKRAKTKLSKLQWRNRNKVLGSKKLENAPTEKVRSARPELNACGQVGADTLG